ncbi:MAG TPA: energy-coupling factor transporter transmembrane component T [Anaerolineae bacterium]|nr:energy-coupling factor transporter transmembrane component T [Anaerolineae bacterium]
MNARGPSAPPNTASLLAWLAAAAVPAFTLRNPLYLVLVLGCAWLVYSAYGRTSLAGNSWGSLVKIGLFLVALTIPFNALANHSGATVLFRLPQSWPVVGGAVTLEAVVAGAANGLGLFCILVVFAAFNAAVDHYELLRATPAFLFQAGVVASIAITFVPQLVLSAREIREAQRIRGHRFRGVRALLPLVLPLLATSLERAIQLAETMEARGFGASVRPISNRQSSFRLAGTLVALLALLAGLFLAAYRPSGRPLSWVLAAAGGLGLLALFWLQGRRVQRTRYRRSPWTARSAWVAAASLAALAGLLIARFTVPELLVYNPYQPNWLLPPFSPWLGAALLLLATPALLVPKGAGAGHGRPETGRDGGEYTLCDEEMVE